MITLCACAARSLALTQRFPINASLLPLCLGQCSLSWNRSGSLATGTDSSPESMVPCHRCNWQRVQLSLVVGFKEPSLGLSPEVLPGSTEASSCNRCVRFHIAVRVISVIARQHTHQRSRSRNIKLLGYQVLLRRAYLASHLRRSSAAMLDRVPWVVLLELGVVAVRLI